MMRTNDQQLANLYGSVVFHIQHRMVLISGPVKSQAGSFNRWKWISTGTNGCRFRS